MRELTAKNFNKSHKSHEKHYKSNKSTWENIENISNQSAIIAGVEYGIFLLKQGEKTFPVKLGKQIPFNLSKQLVVGDKVGIIEENENFSIVFRFPRQSFIARLRGDSNRRNDDSLEEHVFAANIDIAVIVATAAEPEFQPKMIDRYIIICEAGNVQPIICLNKCDLTDERNPILKLYEKDLGIKVIETSAIQGSGIEEFKKFLKNKTSIVIGKSGVGKSSIVNAIIPQLSLATKNIGKNEGTHTTTSSNLYEWQENSFIIDSPGIRKLDVGGIDKKDLKKYFHEFDEYESFCKYKDCLHIEEPENACGIKQAVKQNLISEVRYENYLRIVGE